LQLSTHTLSNNCQPVDFSDEQKNDILENTISKRMAAEGLKVISYGFKDMQLKKLNELMH
jgi:hypothetical protein